MNNKNLKVKGIKAHLNDTKDQHNGLGYAEFLMAVRLGIPKTKAARDFGVSRNQFSYWVKVYLEEL